MAGLSVMSLTTALWWWPPHTGPGAIGDWRALTHGDGHGRLLPAPAAKDALNPEEHLNSITGPASRGFGSRGESVWRVESRIAVTSSGAVAMGTGATTRPSRSGTTDAQVRVISPIPQLRRRACIVTRVLATRGTCFPAFPAATTTPILPSLSSRHGTPGSRPQGTDWEHPAEL
jgi:hypothetical protein